VTVPDSPLAAAPITGLSHVQLLVSDIAASATWYRRVLGLEVYVEDRATGYVALRHRGARLVVVLTRDSGSLDSGRLDHLAFAVSDGEALRVWADHLTEIGVAHNGIVLENGNPSLSLRDPDGIAIELVAPGGRTR